MLKRYLMTVLVLQSAYIFETIRILHFTKHLIRGFFENKYSLLTNASRIMCAAACTSFNGCSVISFSRNQSLCMTSSGTGVYVMHAEWVTFVASLQAKSGSVNTDFSLTSSHTNYPLTLTDLISTTRPHTLLDALENTPKSTTTSMLDVTEMNTESLTMISTVSGSTLGVALSSTADLQYIPVSCPHGFTSSPSGSCFHLSFGRVSVAVADQSCVNYNSRLATITSEEENADVVSLLASKNADLLRDVSIGGSDAVSEGTWSWLTGETFDFTDWLNGVPSNSHPEADCLTYSLANNWKWTDVTCSGPYHYLCEAEPV